MFNKRFKDNYPGVRRPVICNGLKAIVPFKHPSSGSVCGDPSTPAVNPPTDGANGDEGDGDAPATPIINGGVNSVPPATDEENVEAAP